MTNFTTCPRCAQLNVQYLKEESTHVRCTGCGVGWRIDDVNEGRGFTTIEQLIALLRQPDNGASVLIGAVSSGELQDYLVTRRSLSKTLRASLEDVFERLHNTPSLALFVLRHTLTDDALEISSGLAIHDITEVFPAVRPGADGREAVLRGLRDLIADGRLGEWLQLQLTDGVEQVVSIMEAVRRRYPQEMELPLFALLWQLGADIGFPYDGAWAQDSKQLASWIGRDAAHRERGLDLLDRGWIPAWLGWEEPDQFSDILSIELSRGARAETLLWILDPELPGPEVVPDRRTLGISLPEAGPETTFSVTLQPQGNGHAWGEVDLLGATTGITLVTHTFDGTPAIISVRVTPAALHGNPPRDLALVVRVRGPRADQTLTIPIRLTLRPPLGTLLRRVLTAGLVVAAVMSALWILKGSSPTSPSRVDSQPVPPPVSRYSLIGNGIVKKNATGQMLTRLPVAYYKTHSEAIGVCRDLTLGGYSDWELPSKENILQFEGVAGDLGMSFVDFFGGPDICGSHRPAAKIWILDSKNGWGFGFGCPTGRQERASPPAYTGAVICSRTGNVTVERTPPIVARPPAQVITDVERTTIHKPVEPPTTTLKIEPKNDKPENVSTAKILPHKKSIPEGCLVVPGGEVECF